VRFTYAQASADRVDNPLAAGSDPTTPGNVISLDDEWTGVVGSLRVLYHATNHWNVYGGVSQAFRAPSLSDLTAFDSTSVVETPTTDLDPDQYVSFELGTKVDTPCFAGATAVWYTLLDDTIVRSPTGALIDGVPEVRKDNVGDGYVWGLEAEGAWRFRPCWVAFGNLTWMDGEVDQFTTALEKVRDDFDRLMPFTTLLGLRFEPPKGRFWAQAEWVHAEDADRLSLQNETDTQRIPPGGTPGYDVLNLRAGYRVGRDSHLLFAVENLTDENYRIHGSGVNEPGINFVLGLDVRVP
jgi:hemoglobin/transferrin/lactoferrin receptor protein